MFKKVFKLNFKIIIVALLSLVLLQLVTAYIFGFIIKTQMDIQYKHLSDYTLIQVKNHNYHRGIFSSDETTEISLNSQALNKVLSMLPKSSGESITAIDDNKYTIKFASHIEHGILAGIINGYFVPTLAYSKTNITYPDKLNSMLNDFFKNQTPISVNNIIYLDKSGKFLLNSPKFKYKEAVSGINVSWSGMNMLLKYNGSFDKFSADLSIPNFELIAPTKGSVVIKNFAYKSNLSKSPNNIDVGDTKLTLNEAKIKWDDKISIGFKVGDLLHLFTGLNTVQFLNGIDAIDPNSFLFTNISYTSTSNDINNFFNANADIKFESLVTNEHAYGPMNLSVGVNHLNSKGFKDLTNQIAIVTAESESSDFKEIAKTEFIKTLKKGFGPILVDSPVIAINSFTLNTPDGLVDVSGNATTKDFALTDMNDESKFMEHIVMDAKISMPKPIISSLFILQMQYLLSAGNAQMDQQSSDALAKVANILLDNQISIWGKKGYVNESGELLSTHIVMKDGTVLLNGIIGE
jgi:uncharacterized protein YdgA (DUF945 family)